MSTITIILGIVGIISVFIFFYLLRFKASDKQTKRSNRLKWSAFFSYGKRSKSFNKEENSESIEDAQFKD